MPGKTQGLYPGNLNERLTRRRPRRGLPFLIVGATPWIGRSPYHTSNLATADARLTISPAIDNASLSVLRKSAGRQQSGRSRRTSAACASP
jgi:hypothetical protein